MLHDNDDARENDGESEGHVEGNRDQRDLDVHEDQAGPGGLAEGSPGIGHGGIATTTNDGRLDATLEGGVEGDDRVLIGGEERSLNTGEDDVSRDDDEDGADDGDDEDKGGLGEEGTEMLLGDLGLVSVLERRKIETDGVGQESGKPAGNLGGEPHEGHGLPDGVEGALEGRETAPEVQPRGRSDGDVNPGSAELNEDEGREEGSDGDEESAKGAGEDAHEDVGENALDDVDAQTTEVGADATVGAEEAEDGSQGRGNSSGAAIGKLGPVGALLAVVVDGERLVGRWVLILDDGEGRVEVLESILGLEGREKLAFLVY